MVIPADAVFYSCLDYKKSEQSCTTALICEIFFGNFRPQVW